MPNYNKLTPELISQIKAAVKGTVYEGGDINEDYKKDEMPIYGTNMPDLAVVAQSTEDVAAIVKICNDHKIPVTPRGAGTGLVGAAVPVAGGVLIDMSKMNRILSYDLENMVVTIEPGVLLQDLADDCSKQGLMYPPDPGEKLATDPRYMLEGGAKNVARRDGMGTTLLSCVEQMGRIPDAYFQAVGSGTGAIAAWENACRLGEDGRFGENKMRVYVAQNEPFTLMYDSWKAGSRALVDLDPEKGRHEAEVVLASVLSNRKPPYSLAGGLFDTLKASGGDF